MKLPIGGILKAVGNLLLPKAGKVLQGHMTNIGIGTVVAGMAYAGVEAGNPFESLRVLVDVSERAWALFMEAKPHLTIVVGSVVALAGWFRRAGRRAAEG